MVVFSAGVCAADRTERGCAGGGCVQSRAGAGPQHH